MAIVNGLPSETASLNVACIAYKILTYEKFCCDAQEKCPVISVASLKANHQKIFAYLRMPLFPGHNGGLDINVVYTDSSGT